VERKVQHLESLAEALHNQLSALRGSLYENPQTDGPELLSMPTTAASNANGLSRALGQQYMPSHCGDPHEAKQRTDWPSAPAPVGVNDGTGTAGTGISTGVGRIRVDDGTCTSTGVGRIRAHDGTGTASTGGGGIQPTPTEHAISHLLHRGSESAECLRFWSWKDVVNTVGGVVIVAHIVCIGFNAEYSLIDDRVSPVSPMFEHIFLGYYIMEIFVFLFKDGLRKSFHDRWFCFDLLLVGVAILSQWLYPLIVYLTTDKGDVIGLEKALIIRILRLGRLLRALRVIESFKDLWKLVAGILRSTRTVASACILIFITLYVFALVGVEVVRKDQTLLDDETTRELVLSHFDSVFGCLLTLVQFANADSIAGLYDPMIRVQPGLVFYFGTVWIVVTILLMNLVTAVVIQNAIDIGAEDAEAAATEKRKRLEKMVPLLKQAFETVDRSSDGMLQIDEVELLCNLSLPRELKEIMAKDRMRDLFKSLDTDGSGDVSMGEFVKGVCHIALSEVPIETTQMLSMMRIQSKVLDQLFIYQTGKPPHRSSSSLA
jgi:hypothetical protein